MKLVEGRIYLWLSDLRKGFSDENNYYRYIGPGKDKENVTLELIINGEIDEWYIYDFYEHDPTVNDSPTYVDRLVEVVEIE